VHCHTADCDTAACGTVHCDTADCDTEQRHVASYSVQQWRKNCGPPEYSSVFNLHFPIRRKDSFLVVWWILQAYFTVANIWSLLHTFIHSVHYNSVPVILPTNTNTCPFIHNKLLKILSFYMFRTLLAHRQGVMMMDSSGSKHVDVYCF
jgi:hypothetical protein